MVAQISCCRICRSERLTEVLSLGEQALTGVFPRSSSDTVTAGPLTLVWCESCSLLQLKESYSLDEMYGSNYGYRSGLNAGMARHLQQKIGVLEALASPSDGDLVIDIGSNDATSLKAYRGHFTKVGIDPTGEKFRQYYPSDVILIPDFFSAEAFRRKFPKEKAKVVTSIAMFYDLEEPQKFIADIEAVLADDGIWHFEQSYMPSMLRTTAYDTICHEHLEFYSLRVVIDLLKRCRMRAIDVQMNSINGGSFAVTACKENAPYQSNASLINWTLRHEEDLGIRTLKPYREFAEKVFKHRAGLKDLIETLVADGKKIVGYGASTKGNVLLQFCGLDNRFISAIAEVNEDKFGALTPGTHIPIVSEADARQMKPDYFLVLPWHFKSGIIEREREFLADGGHLIFPLPEIEIL
jgi:hypothetical protein